MKKHLKKITKRGTAVFVVSAAIITTLTVLLAWQIYKNNNVQGLDGGTPKILGQNCPDKIQPGVAIFYYKEGTTKSRLDEIIASVNGTIDREYESLKGFSLKVTVGSEEETVAKLKTNPEVTTASVSRTACLQ